MPTIVDSIDCLALAGVAILLKGMPEDSVKCNVDEECPICIEIKDKLLSMRDEEFAVNIEGTKVSGCETFFKHILLSLQQYILLIWCILQSW